MHQITIRVKDEVHKELIKIAAQKQLESGELVSITSTATEIFNIGYDIRYSPQTVSETVSTENVQEDTQEWRKYDNKAEVEQAIERAIDDEKAEETAQEYKDEVFGQSEDEVSDNTEEIESKEKVNNVKTGAFDFNF